MADLAQDHFRGAGSNGGAAMQLPSSEQTSCTMSSPDIARHPRNSHRQINEITLLKHVYSYHDSSARPDTSDLPAGLTTELSLFMARNSHVEPL